MKANQQHKHFEQYYPKLLAEAILKSLFSGLIVGFAAAFVTSVATWITGGWWIALVTFGVVTAIASVIYFFFRYRPTVKDNARRLDGLGLEERLITMIELEGDDSYMATLQRTDAKESLSKLEKKSIKFVFPRKVFVALAISAFLGSGMTTVAVLGDAGLLPGGDEIIKEILPEEREVYVAVTYLVEDGGEILGEADQLILIGSNAETVTAVPFDGYQFVGWDDGGSRPTRQERKVNEDFIVMAIFEPIQEEGEGDGDGDGQDGPADEDAPPGDQPGEQSQNGNPGAPSDQPTEDPGQSGGGKYDDFNQIIDGKTYYRDLLESYKDIIKDYLEENGDSLTEEEKKIIEAYIGIV